MMDIEEIEEALFSHNWPGLIGKDSIKKLIAVAKAAKNDALLWNEELCNREECEQMYQARLELSRAIKELGLE